MCHMGCAWNSSKVANPKDLMKWLWVAGLPVTEKSRELSCNLQCVQYPEVWFSYWVREWSLWRRREMRSARLELNWWHRGPLVGLGAFAVISSSDESTVSLPYLYSEQQREKLSCWYNRDLIPKIRTRLEVSQHCTIVNIRHHDQFSHHHSLPAGGSQDSFPGFASILMASKTCRNWILYDVLHPNIETRRWDWLELLNIGSMVILWNAKSL
jgi:hypothetical protein